MTDFDACLALVEKPARYIDHETHAARKPFSADRANFCFAYPDVYEVGFSHQGLKLLYGIVNALDYAAADRVYCPWPDLAAILRERDLPLFSIESREPLTRFDAVGFTLQSELTFTNVLEMLDLAQIPIHAVKRTDEHPIILGGGPSISNPAPLAMFFDAILIGEGEEAIIETAKALQATKGRPRAERLRALAAIKGMYTPHTPQPLPIRVRKYAGFSSGDAGLRNQLIPWLTATHDRYVAEVMRGCTRGCRFCHAGFFYRPSRERDAATIVDLLETEVKRDGWEEAAFTSLSSSDYTPIRSLMQETHARLEGGRVGLSLPSLRVDTLDDEIVELLGRIGKAGLTVAPEAGSQRLRDIINKNITDDEIMDGARLAVRHGWQLVKLYFMVGLPHETMEDVEAIAEMVERILFIDRRLRVNITVSPFVPKPFTPFQWAGINDKDTLLNKINMLRNRLRRYKNVKMKYHGVELAMLEGIISRGDERVGEWIEAAWKRGARFDGWDEYFQWERWRLAADDIRLDFAAQTAPRALDAPLPWDCIDLGVKREYLLSEWSHAAAGQTTPDCREGCTGCGLCDADIQPQRALTSIPQKVQTPAPEVQGQPIHYRAYIDKAGLLRFVSHLDFMRRIQRALQASGLPLAYSQGFNPHPRLSLSPPLPVGVEGAHEFMDFALVQDLPPEEVKRTLRAVLPPELTLHEVRYSLGSKEREMEASRYEIVTVDPGQGVDWAQSVLDFMSAASWPFERERKGAVRTADLRALIFDVQWENGVLTVAKELSGASVFDLLEQVMGTPREQTAGYRIVRRGLYSAPPSLNDSTFS